MSNFKVSSSVDDFMQSSAVNGMLGVLGISNSTLTGDIQNGLRKWRAARAKALNGSQFSRINFYGDSLTQGLGASTPAWLNSYVGRFRTAWNSQYGGTPGTGVCIPYSGSQAETDARFVYSGSWAFGQNGILNSAAAVASGNTNTLTFTPTDTSDSFTVYYITGSGGGTFSISINGGAPTLVNSNGSGGFAKASISGTSGMNSLIITAPAVNSCYICAVEATSGTGGVLISRLGVGGTSSSDLNDNITIQFGLMPPDLSIFAMGVNDFLNQNPVANMVSSLTSAISTAQQTGDVLLEIEVPPGDSETIPWTSYAAATYELSTSLDIALLDHTSRWGSFAISNPLGLYADLHHPNDSGNAELFRSFIETLIYR